MVSYADLDELDDDLDFESMFAEKDTADIDADLSDEYMNHEFYKVATSFKNEYVDSMKEYSCLIDHKRNADIELSHFNNEIDVEYFENLELGKELFSEVSKSMKKVKKVVEERSKELDKKINEVSKKVSVNRRLARVYMNMDSESKFTCFLCLNDNVNRVFLPCYHTVCSGCSKVGTCPFCRVKVQGCEKLYFAT